MLERRLLDESLGRVGVECGVAKTGMSPCHFSPSQGLTRSVRVLLVGLSWLVAPLHAHWHVPDVVKAPGGGGRSARGKREMRDCKLARRAVQSLRASTLGPYTSQVEWQHTRVRSASLWGDMTEWTRKVFRRKCAQVAFRSLSPLEEAARQHPNARCDTHHFLLWKDLHQSS